MRKDITEINGIVKFLDLYLFVEDGSVIFVRDRSFYEVKLYPHKVIVKDHKVLYIPAAFSLSYFIELYNKKQIILIPECFY